MPEGPEVKTIAEQISNEIVEKTIKNVSIISGRYTKTKIEGLDQFTSSLPLTVSHIGCKGKFIWWEFKNSNYSMWNTLGMTGGWTTKNSKYEKVKFSFQDMEGELTFYDIRNFGTIKFSSSKSELKRKLASIGYDMLSSPPDLLIFKNLIHKNGNENITKFLMNQKYISGIGNYIKSEALYAAKISPYRLCSSLSHDDCERLYNAIIFIINASYNSGGATIKNYLNFNGEIGAFTFKVYGLRTDPYGNSVVTCTTKDGRTTHWVPEMQK